jgi:hypothetical protein
MRGCSLLPEDRMVLSCYNTDYVSFINKEGVELFQIGKDRTGSDTFDAVYITPDISPLMISLTDLSLRFNIFSPLFRVE